MFSSILFSSLYTIVTTYQTKRFGHRSRPDSQQIYTIVYNKKIISSNKIINKEDTLLLLCVSFSCSKPSDESLKKRKTDQSINR